MDFSKILNYLENKEYEKAISALLEMKDENKNEKSDIYLEIAKIYEQLNDNINALKYLNLACDFSNNGNVNHIKFELAKVYCFDKKYDKSIEILKDLLLRINSIDELYFNCSILLSKNYENIYDFNSSLNVIKNLMIKFPNNEILEKEHIELNKKIYQRFPGNYNFDGDYYKLIDIYTDILKINHSNNQILCFLAQTYNYLGMYDKTQELYLANHEYVQDNVFFRNKFLNEYEIASKKIVLESKPRNLMVVLSNKCNLNCIMCLTHREKWELPKKILDEIIDLFPFLERIYWQGGEVLSLPYFKSLLGKSLQYPNLRQCIITNFQLADDEFIDLVVKNNIELTISIDGVDKNTYEKIRVGGSFDRLTNNLKKLNNRIKETNNNKTILNLNVVVMRENYDKLADFVDFANEYGFSFICFMNLQFLPRNPSEKDKQFKIEQDIFTYYSQEEQKKLSFQMKLVYKKAEKYGIRIESRIPIIDLNEDDILRYDTNNEFLKGNKICVEKKSIINEKEINIEIENIKNNEKEIKNKEETKNKVNSFNNKNVKLLCHLPWYSLTLDFDGSVRPDCQCNLHNPVARLDKSSINKLWNNHKTQEYRANIIKCNYKKNKCSKNCIEGRITNYHLKLL